MNLFELYNKFRQNPMSMLQKRYNIPAGMQNPNEIINHLVQTGQVSQAQIQQLNQMRNIFSK